MRSKTSSRQRWATRCNVEAPFEVLPPGEARLQHVGAHGLGVPAPADEGQAVQHALAVVAGQVDAALPNLPLPELRHWIVAPEPEEALALLGLVAAGHGPGALVKKAWPFQDVNSMAFSSFSAGWKQSSKRPLQST